MRHKINTEKQISWVFDDSSSLHTKHYWWYLLELPGRFSIKHCFWVFIRYALPHKIYLMGIHYNRPVKVILMNTHSISLYGEIWKLIPKLSSNTHRSVSVSHSPLVFICSSGVCVPII